jgi:polyketide synthase PksN
MGVDPGLERIMEQNTGLVPMATATGLAAFYQGLALGVDQVIVVEGNTTQLRRSFGLPPTAGHQAASPVIQHEAAPADEAFYRRLAERVLSGELSAEQMEKLILGSA